MPRQWTLPRFCSTGVFVVILVAWAIDYLIVYTPGRIAERPRIPTLPLDASGPIPLKHPDPRWVLDGRGVRLVVHPSAAWLAAPYVALVREAIGPSCVVALRSHIIHATDADVHLIHILDRFSPRDLATAALTVMISGEPWSVAAPGVDAVIVPLHDTSVPAPTFYLPFVYASLMHRLHRTYPRVWPKTLFCAFLYHKSWPHRDAWFHRLSQYKRVDGLGRVLHNVPAPPLTTRFLEATAIPGDRFDRHVHLTGSTTVTYNDLAVEAYAPYRFVLSIENTWADGYATEKLVNPILAHSVPLYWGM
jgi:hypothetical protein